MSHRILGEALLWRAGLGRSREPGDCGGFKNVEGACVYLLVLGTQWVGIVWVM